MQIIVWVKKLQELLDLSTRFVSRNTTLPVLQNIYLKASIDNLIIRATDMEKYIEIETPCDIKSEWAITVNAKMFSDIINTVEDENIEITVNQKNFVLTIKTTKDNFDVNWISASEYIALPEVPQDNKIKLPTHNLSEWIEKVEYAIVEKNFSPVLTGMLLKSKEVEWEQKLIFVWTDSFRLSEYRIDTQKLDNNISLIIPKVSINDIKKICDYAISKENEEVILEYSENLASFSFKINDTKIQTTTLIIQWNFPEYDREDVMPKTFNTTIMVDKNLCEKAIKKIWILTRDINNFIKIETQWEQIIISSWETEKWKWTTSIPSIVSWENISFGINGKYIQDFIRTIKWDEIIFNIVDNQKPLIIKNKEEENYSYVVRPLMN